MSLPWLIQYANRSVTAGPRPSGKVPADFGTGVMGVSVAFAAAGRRPSRARCSCSSLLYRKTPSGFAVMGLVLGTAYWIDLMLGATVGGTAAAKNITVTAFEF